MFMLCPEIELMNRYKMDNYFFIKYEKFRHTKLCLWIIRNWRVVEIKKEHPCGMFFSKIFSEPD